MLDQWRGRLFSTARRLRKEEERPGVRSKKARWTTRRKSSTGAARRTRAARTDAPITLRGLDLASLTDQTRPLLECDA